MIKFAWVSLALMCLLSVRGYYGEWTGQIIASFAFGAVLAEMARRIYCALEMNSYLKILGILFLPLIFIIHGYALTKFENKFCFSIVAFVAIGLIWNLLKIFNDAIPDFGSEVGKFTGKYSVG